MKNSWIVGLSIVVCIALLSLQNGLSWFTVLGIGAGMALIGSSIGEGGHRNE